MTDAALLTEWLDQLIYEEMRGVESRLPDVRRPNGRRLQGVEIVPGTYLARDKQFYGTSPEHPVQAIVLTVDEVLARVPLSQIQREVAARLQANAHRIALRAEHRARWREANANAS